MNNDRISNTPGGERMLFGAIVFGFALMTWHGLRYELGSIGHGLLVALMIVGLFQLGRGLIAWKYTDREEFVASKPLENLYVDVPLSGHSMQILYAIEDALIELIRVSRSVSIQMHSIDTANNVGTIHLTGRNADAMFAHIYATLLPFAKTGGLNLFPPQGQALDTEIHGKRAMVIVPEGKGST